MQHSGKWNTTSQILKPKNIKLRDINGLTSSQIKKMSVRCRSQENMLGLTTQHDSQARLCFSLLSWRRCLDIFRDVQTASGYDRATPCQW